MPKETDWLWSGTLETDLLTGEQILHTDRVSAYPADVWRYYSFRVFCGTNPLERGIVKWYIGNDKPDSEPVWVANYHREIPGSREIARKEIDATMDRIAASLHRS